VGIAPPTGRQTQCRLEPPDAITAALASLGGRTAWTHACGSLQGARLRSANGDPRAHERFVCPSTAEVGLLELPL